MKNKYCMQYYKVLKGLFPRLSFWNGKFLKDVKTQLSAFSILHPNATYDDVVDAFGLPEEVVEEFLNSQDSSQLHNKVLVHRYIRLTFYGILIALALFIIGTYALFFASYQEFIKYNPASSETTVEQGIISE